MAMALKYSTQLLPTLLALHLILTCVQYASADADDAAAVARKRINEEEDEIGYIQSLIVNTPSVASVQSAYQNIEVYDSDHFGRVFVLDDCLQLTERDAPHYNEMLAHVPVMEYLARRDGVDPQEKLRVLVVGGGDGYVVSELLKHSRVESIDHVELDEEVINVSREHLPWGDAWQDERVNLVIGDGAAYVKEQAERGRSYHVVVQDASDPYWLDEEGNVTTLPSSVLYDISHFASLYKLLKPKEGVLLFQAETYNIPSNLQSIRKWRDLLRDIGFDEPRYGSISISTYPTGQIGFFAAHVRDGNVEGGEVCRSDEACDDGTAMRDKMEASPEVDWNVILARFNELGGKTLYYHPRVHRSSYDLPLWVEEYLNGNGSGV